MAGKNEEVHGGKGNLSCKREIIMALLSEHEERFGTCLPSWAGLPLNHHVQELGRKDHELGYSFSCNNTLSKRNLSNDK